jgi:hypothetical protein
MRGPLYVLLFVSVSFFSSAQCLTDFSKLVPEPSLDYANNYGRSFALYDNYLAIGLPEHDTLGRITGIVYLYERIADSWKKIDFPPLLVFHFAVLPPPPLLVFSEGLRSVTNKPAAPESSHSPPTTSTLEIPNCFLHYSKNLHLNTCTPTGIGTTLL